MKINLAREDVPPLARGEGARKPGILHQKTPLAVQAAAIVGGACHAAGKAFKIVQKSRLKFDTCYLISALSRPSKKYRSRRQKIEKIAGLITGR
ncbi:hypothetical protein J2858_002142 [Neorhizobium galegae]|uniref:hypothetical protein n=1 Tax=Neorhizobium galegae TaxID=399 RepID=UPI001AE22314|nr:hypothetical protein [Neorhizobium galegae]MBP2549219.1 hypothetical protein [Neorhizobium galegae]